MVKLVAGEPSLPPIFRLDERGARTDVRQKAIEMAVAGTDAGTILWPRSREAFACALILAPDDPLVKSAETFYIAALGLLDAMAQALPPMQDVTFAVPGTMLLNGAYLGRLQVDAPTGAGGTDVPGWLVVSINLRIAGVPDYEDLVEGFMPTSLIVEGIMNVTSADLLSAFSRHFLLWLRRWQDDGFAPLRVQWKHRAHELGTVIERPVAGREALGKFEDLNDRAELIFRAGKTRVKIPPIELIQRSG